MADSIEKILTFMERLHAESISVFGGLTDADLRRKCPTVGGAEVPIPVYLRSMIEHEIHHRGEMYVYLGILGVTTPPLYGLTSEEVRARSAVGEMPR